MCKISAIQRAGRAVAQCFRTRTVCSNSKSLFSFAQRHNLKNSGVELSEDGMILTHITDFLPRDGYIYTARTAIGASRDSVHFAVNHGVSSHLGGDWSNKKYAILIPMRAARAESRNKFVGGIVSDFFSHGRVKIPEGSIIVKRTDTIKPGKFRISDASKIDEFKQLHGVKVIETSNPNMKESVDSVVKKLGYNLRNVDNPFKFGNDVDKSILTYIRTFNRFLTKNGMKPMLHTYTPNGRIDQLLSNLHLKAQLNRGWQFVKDGEVIFDTRKGMLDALKYINEYAKTYNYPLDFDINKLSRIIQKSASPKEAADLLKSEMNIFSMVDDNALNCHKMLNESQSEALLYINFDTLVDSPFLRKADAAINKYLSNPSSKNLKEIKSLDARHAEFIEPDVLHILEELLG